MKLKVTSGSLHAAMYVAGVNMHVSFDLKSPNEKYKDVDIELTQAGLIITNKLKKLTGLIPIVNVKAVDFVELNEKNS